MAIDPRNTGAGTVADRARNKDDPGRVVVVYNGLADTYGANPVSGTFVDTVTYTVADGVITAIVLS